MDTEREPRAHHFVPQCWLAGFTETGEKDGQLWVTDLHRRKQWLSSPVNSGRRRDFYRTSADETFKLRLGGNSVTSASLAKVAPIYAYGLLVEHTRKINIPRR
jgi:hypothetical protein